MRSADIPSARKLANYENQGKALHAALCELWPDPARKVALRLVSMASMGALRPALATWSEAKRKRPVVAFLDQAFASLKAEI